MTTKPAVDWRNVHLRANPAYELVLFDRLLPQEQRSLEALRRDPNGYGVLRPVAASGLDPAGPSAKFVSRDTALLWFTLQQASPLPRYALEMLGEGCNNTLGQMILDGVLEIESEGQMLSGPAASALICPRTVSASVETGAVSLSRRAIEYGSALEITDAVTLAGRLYDYNRFPACAEWRRLLPDSSAVERYLGIEEGATGRSLRRDWVRLRPEGKSNPWIAWSSSRRPIKSSQIKPGQKTCKLYVSAACSHMRTAFEATAEVLDQCNAVHWKVGADLYGLLRPDKLVAYFSDTTDLHRASELILERIESCPAHGVPFTSQLDGNGLLWSGIDPPADEFALPWLQGESWRVKICNRLAAALLLAKSTKVGSAAAISFAMERLRLEGIDPDTWTLTFDPESTAADSTAPNLNAIERKTSTWS